MRKLWVCSLLVCSAFGFVAGIAQAQTACPIKLTITSNEVDGANVSSKAIVLIGLKVSTQAANPTIASHDFYFVPMVPGDSYALTPGDDNNPITAATVAVVQFDDGTTWGNAALLATDEGLAGLIAQRPRMLELYKGGVAAYNQGGDTALINYFTSALPHDAGGVAHKYLRVAQTSGGAAAISLIQTRLNNVAVRSF